MMRFTQSHPLKRISILAVLLGVALLYNGGSANAASSPSGSASFLLMIAEQPAPGAPLNQWWMNEQHQDLGIAGEALARELAENQLMALTPDHISPQWRVNHQELSRETLKAIGSSVQADFVVVGKAMTSLKGLISGGAAMQVEADISVKVLAVETGNWIASGARKAVAAYPLIPAAAALAIRKAGAELGRNLSDILAIHPSVQEVLLPPDRRRQAP